MTTKAEMARTTIEAFASTWLRHGFANFARTLALPTIAGLAFPRVPAVLVSPGPSLDKNVHLLPALKGRALLVASPHAAITMMRSGVAPDVVVVLDPQELVLRQFDGLRTTGIHALALTPLVHPGVFDVPLPQITYAGNGVADAWIFDAMGEAHAGIETGGSVAGAALALALRWGCGPIALVGQDLSFDDGRMYATTSDYGHVRAVERDGSVEFLNHLTPCGDQAAMLPGYAGGTVNSSQAYARFHGWFERTCRAQPNRIANCTEGGARIEGTEQLALHEWASRYALDTLEIGAYFARLPAVDIAARNLSARQYLKESVERLSVAHAFATGCAGLAAVGDESNLRIAEPLLRAVLGSAVVLVELTKACEVYASRDGIRPKCEMAREVYLHIASACAQLAPAIAQCLS